MTGTISLKFGDAGKNHWGMEIIGNKKNVGDGFTKKDLDDIYGRMRMLGLGGNCETYCLNDLLKGENEKKQRTKKAYIMIIRNAMKTNLLNEVEFEEMKKEMNSFEWDTKCFDIRSGVTTKNVRHNVCFNKEGQEPDYEKGKGRIVGFNTLKYFNKMRQNLKLLIGEKMEEMICEGDKYYDTSKCGNKWHGDEDRREVIGCRIGEEMDLCFNWYFNELPVGEKLELLLQDGDIYIMSEKAVGTDWIENNIYTLKHAVNSIGNNHFTKFPKQQQDKLTIKQYENTISELFNSNKEKDNTITYLINKLTMYEKNLPISQTSAHKCTRANTRSIKQTPQNQSVHEMLRSPYIQQHQHHIKQFENTISKLESSNKDLELSINELELSNNELELSNKDKDATITYLMNKNNRTQKR